MTPASSRERASTASATSTTGCRSGWSPPPARTPSRGDPGCCRATGPPPAPLFGYDRLSACRASADLLGQPDENALGASDVAEPIHVFVLDHFVDELGAVLAEPGQRIVEVVHREHDAEVAEGVHRCVPELCEIVGKRVSGLLYSLEGTSRLRPDGEHRRNYCRFGSLALQARAATRLDHALRDLLLWSGSPAARSTSIATCFADSPRIRFPCIGAPFRCPGP